MFQTFPCILNFFLAIPKDHGSSPLETVNLKFEAIAVCHCSVLSYDYTLKCPVYRKRIYAEEKAKVVAAVRGGGAEFLAVLAILFATMIGRKGWIPPILQIILVQNS